jgi:hypothetical protein
MQWLGTLGHTIFLILLRFQNLWNLINVFIKKFYENVYINVSYDFSKFNGSRIIKCNIRTGTTQGWACLYWYYFLFIDK